MMDNNKNADLISEIKETIFNNMVNVENMTSSKNRDIPNQFIINGTINNKRFVLFQSYNSPIVMKYKGLTFIFKNWDYSTTTGKYRNIFLDETKKETLAKLKSGEYIAVDFEV